MARNELDPAYKLKMQEQHRLQQEREQKQAEEARKAEEEANRIRKEAQRKENERRQRIENMIKTLEGEEEETSQEDSSSSTTNQQGWNLSLTRFLTTLSLEKPIYSTEDSLVVRAHFFNVHSLIPLASEITSILHQTSFVFEILNSERETIDSFNGSWCGYYVQGHKQLSLPGGDYKVRLTVINQMKGLFEFGQSEREFSVQAYSSPPRFRKHLEFAQKGYGPGDKACAKLEVTMAEGGVPENAKVIATAQLKGNEFYRQEISLGDDGSAIIDFTLPDEPLGTSGILSVSVDDGSVTESISKTIPILMNNIQVKFYPEGGSIVEGLVNYVYVEANMNSEDPADIDAVIFEKRPDGSEVPIQRFHTIHEGRGKFSFTPKENHVYRCQIIRPDIGEYEPVLPEILENGVSLHALKEVYEADEDISMAVGATNACVLLARVYRKEVLVYQEELHFSEETIRESNSYVQNNIASCVSVYGNHLRKKETSNVSNVDLSLYGGGSIPLEFFEDTYNSSSVGAYMTQDDEEEEDENPLLSHPAIKIVSFDRNSKYNNFVSSGGVFRLVVSDKKTNVPFCERIVYRQCPETLRVTVLTDKELYTTNETPTIAVKITQQDGKAVEGAVVSVCATDDSALQMQERRLQHPHLPAMVLLESDVECLRDMGIYLPEFLNNTNAFEPSKLDLLLGVQGWRRFVFSFDTKEKQEQFLSKYPGNAPALLGISTITNQPVKVPPSFYTPTSVTLHYDSDDYEEGLLAPPGPPPGSHGASLVPSYMTPPPTGPYGSFSSSYGASLVPSYKGMAPQAPPPPGYANTPQAPPGYRTAEQAQLHTPWSSVGRGYGTNSYQSPSHDRGRGGGGMPSQRLSNISAMKEEKCKKKVRKGKRMSSRKSSKIQATYYQYSPYYSYSRPKSSKETLINSVNKTGKQGVTSYQCTAAENITQYRISVSCFHPERAILGYHAESFINIKQPFYIQSNLPKTFTVDDRITIPIGLVNTSEEDFDDVTLTLVQIINPRNFSRALPRQTDILNSGSCSVSHNSRSRHNMPLQFYHSGEYQIQIQGEAKTEANTFQNQKEFSCDVFRRDFVEYTRELGSLSEDVELQISIPETTHELLECSLYLWFPYGESIVQEYQRLIREPHGCTEQIASTCYLMALAMQKFKQEPPGPSQFKSIQRCESHLISGYKKLKEMECRNGGFEWWGGMEGHVGITAFVVNVLSEMKQVFTGVEDTLLQSTMDWMMTQRQNGRWKIPSTVSCYGRGPKECTEAYVCWTLTSHGKEYHDMQEELDFLFRYPAVGKDTYVLCLVAMTLMNVGRTEDAQKLAKRLTLEQHEEGFIKNSVSSITNSFGIGLVCETTSLAILAWLQIDPVQYSHSIEKAVDYIHKYSGRSTQPIALKTKADYMFQSMIKGNSVAPAYKPFEIKVNGKTLDSYDTEAAYYNSYHNGYKSHDLSKLISPGDNQVEIVNPYGVGLCYYLSTSYTSLEPPSHPDATVTMSLTLAKEEINLGENVAVTVQVSNSEDIPSGMVTAQIGVPSGLLVNYKQLQEFVKSNVISFYEVSNGILTLYWRGILPRESREFVLNFIGMIPGFYASSPSCIYPYYAPEYIHWNSPLEITINQKD